MFGQECPASRTDPVAQRLGKKVRRLPGHLTHNDPGCDRDRVPEVRMKADQTAGECDDRGNATDSQCLGSDPLLAYLALMLFRFDADRYDPDTKIRKRLAVAKLTDDSAS